MNKQQPKRTEPSKHLYKGHVYRPADKTDIRITFRRAIALAQLLGRPDPFEEKA